ncbi:hypothetical protein SAMN04515668_4518 [Hymenobacter arizonensis]|uniref:Uncharacterized protein n=1 Tax=Hymenobacter arizonensis TaxID=1227077 RepID=A0A1I6BG69_HYMAR|nr:hypothetical protein SAMN04515668_4518 [Hymenobacter arizonensis]
MLAKPNKSVFQGRVRAIRSEEDGWGANIDLVVTKNESPILERDFLRPAPGSVVTVFAANPAKIQVGESLRVHANLTAGPFGGRAVAESLTRV